MFLVSRKSLKTIVTYQSVENAKNRYFQHDLEAMRQTFQQQMLEYQLDKNQELQTFIKNVDIAIAKDN
jgi:hypothetical protein